MMFDRNGLVQLQTAAQFSSIIKGLHHQNWWLHNRSTENTQQTEKQKKIFFLSGTTSEIQPLNSGINI